MAEQNANKKIRSTLGSSVCTNVSFYWMKTEKDPKKFQTKSTVKKLKHIAGRVLKK